MELVYTEFRRLRIVVVFEIWKHIEINRKINWVFHVSSVSQNISLVTNVFFFDTFALRQAFQFLIMLLSTAFFLLWSCIKMNVLEWRSTYETSKIEKIILKPLYNKEMFFFKYNHILLLHKAFSVTSKLMLPIPRCQTWHRGYCSSP